MCLRQPETLLSTLNLVNKNMNTPISTQPPRRNLLAALIFASRWLQLPIYLGLIVVQAIYS